MLKSVIHCRAVEHNWNTTFSFIVHVLKITQELVNYAVNMNLIIILEFFMMITLVVTRRNVAPRPRHDGNIESSSSQAEVGMYFCSHFIQLIFPLAFTNYPDNMCNISFISRTGHFLSVGIFLCNIFNTHHPFI
jgi:hypothetical protein